METGHIRVETGVVHEISDDLKEALTSDVEALDRWNDLTPLARNEWICWTISVKRGETRGRRVERVIAGLKGAKRGPCCWPGCRHR